MYGVELGILACSREIAYIGPGRGRVCVCEGGSLIHKQSRGRLGIMQVTHFVCGRLQEHAAESERGCFAKRGSAMFLGSTNCGVIAQVVGELRSLLGLGSREAGCIQSTNNAPYIAFQCAAMIPQISITRRCMTLRRQGKFSTSWSDA
jgi:hypothetical protein